MPSTITALPAATVLTLADMVPLDKSIGGQTQHTPLQPLIDGVSGAGVPCFGAPLTLFNTTNSSVNDAAYQTFDCSPYVPLGAIAAYVTLHHYVGATANNSTYLAIRGVGQRAGGINLDGSIVYLFAPVVGFYFSVSVWVPLSPARAFEYQRVNVGANTARYWSIDLLGWV